jgi:hypothetical protein
MQRQIPTTVKASSVANIPPIAPIKAQRSMFVLS